MRLFPLLVILLFAISCRQVEVEKIPPSLAWADTGQAVVGQGYNLTYLMERRYGGLADRPQTVAFATTPSGRIRAGTSSETSYASYYYYYYNSFSQTLALYYPTEQFVFIDSIQVQVDGRPATAIPILSYLQPVLEARRQSPLYCPAGGTVTIDLNPLHKAGLNDTSRFMLFRPARLGSVTLQSNLLTYTVSAATGIDTFSVARAGLAPLAMRVLIGSQADADCLERLTLRPDTIRLSDFNAETGYYNMIPISALLANDDYCPDYLDLTSLRLYRGYDSTANYINFSYRYPLFTRFDQARFIAGQYVQTYYLNGLYEYSIATIDGTQRTSRVTIQP